MTGPMPWRLQIAALVSEQMFSMEIRWGHKPSSADVAQKCLEWADALIAEHSKASHESDQSEMARTIQRLERRVEFLRCKMKHMADHSLNMRSKWFYVEAAPEFEAIRNCLLSYLSQDTEAAK